MKNDILTLRAIEPEDLEILYEWENDSSIWIYGDTLTPYSKYAIKQYIVDSSQDIFTTKQLRFMVVANLDQRTIGTIDLFDFSPNDRRVSVGVLIHDISDRSKGYGDVTLKLIMEYCSSILNIHTIHCNILSENKPCIQLFRNNDFTYVGTLKDWMFINNKWHNIEVYTKILCPI